MKPLIVALDVHDEKAALNLVDMLSPWVDIFKVGPILFLKTGPSLIKEIKKRGKEVFLDLKFHDIPNTVKESVVSAATLGVYSLTLHSSGGEEMIKAVSELKNRPKLWCVTVLTSQNATPEQVVERALLAKKSGADGVIASAHEAGFIKKACGKDFTVVTPGIRLASTNDDQKRVATPSLAIQNGADFIVVGRPIIESDSPAKIAKQIIDEIQSLH